MEVKYINYFMVIFFGAIMAGGVFAKLVFGFYIDSDWFWFFAGVGLVFDGVATLKKQKQFDRKYKILER